MNKQFLWWLAFAVLATAFALIQFIPSAPVTVPDELPAEESGEAADPLAALRGAKAPWLQLAGDTIDLHHGDFGACPHEGLDAASIRQLHRVPLA
ncbi:hypothetical protein DWB85_01095 [Seongchinamella sediminis]|uniref:Uncharacterized protein n=1 Tax=Seongchinamella sediminis TaxID=2283635 RepID=A0A3L7E1Q4_9GAMM|nr:hypothetical protein [Seongchinamella sediminis]RLQ23778.1 hypothetical protein DWB85_01095 [Seongchinamella sediminis]